MTDPGAARRLFNNSRKEAIIVGVVWALAFAWTIGYCYLFGYSHDETSPPVRLGIIEANPKPQPRQILGFPDWVLIGIMLPWVACTLFTIWFGWKWMSDDDLGIEAKDEEQSHGH
jgi:hypothetical protein